MSAWRHPNHRPADSLPVELRRTTVTPAARVWVARITGQPIVRVERLAGASSTAVHRLRVPDGHSLVLRRYLWPGFLDEEPIAPQRELEALGVAAAHNLPVPLVIAADITGDDIGDGIPTILMTFLPGRALAVPDPVRLAEMVASVHAAGPSGLSHHYYPWFADLPVRPPSTARRPHLWEHALEVRVSAMPSYRPTFIHRDFHPGNVLWRHKHCVGIVDWANGCRGPAGCDIATCHGNLISWAGYEVADDFVAAYEALTGEPHHPYWEIASVLEHGPSPWTSLHIAQSERRLDRAIATLGRT
jgi:aminoglycoside phosphotransferase (APT) family kinase protein